MLRAWIHSSTSRHVCAKKKPNAEAIVTSTCESDSRYCRCKKCPNLRVSTQFQIEVMRTACFRVCGFKIRSRRDCNWLRFEITAEQLLAENKENWSRSWAIPYRRRWSKPFWRAAQRNERPVLVTVNSRRSVRLQSSCANAANTWRRAPSSTTAGSAVALCGNGVGNRRRRNASDESDSSVYDRLARIVTTLPRQRCPEAENRIIVGGSCWISLAFSTRTQRSITSRGYFAPRSGRSVRTNTNDFITFVMAFREIF